MTTQNPTDSKGEALKPCECKSAVELRYDRIEVGNWVQVICDNCGRRGAYGGSRWMAAKLWNQDCSRASVAAVEGDAQTIYADGYCARCSELAYPLTRALEKTGVPTGADNWQQTYGPNKVRALADLETCLRRLLNAIDEGEPKEIASRVEWAKHFIEFHAAIRRRLTALAQDAAATAPLPAEPPQVSNHVFTCAGCGRQWTVDSIDSLECFFVGMCYWCIRQHRLTKDRIDTHLRSLLSSPRCPKCGYVMCQQFDSRPVNALADIAIPNGRYICYRCTDATPAQPAGEQDERETFAAKHFTFGPCVHSMTKPDCPSCCQSHAIRMEMQLGKLEASTALPIRERVEKALREHMVHCYQVYRGVPPTVDDWIGGALHYVMWGLENDIPLPAATPPDTPVVAREAATRCVAEIRELVGSANNGSPAGYIVFPFQKTVDLILKYFAVTPSSDANAAATEICDYCGIDTSDAERVAAIITRHFVATTAPDETVVGGEAQLHYPFAARHANCAECDREYEVPNCVHRIGMGGVCDDCKAAAPANAAGDDEGERDARLRLESIAEPWICAEEKPCEEAVSVHWDEMITALVAAERRSK